MRRFGARVPEAAATGRDGACNAAEAAGPAEPLAPASATRAPSTGQARKAITSASSAARGTAPQDGGDADVGGSEGRAVSRTRSNESRVGPLVSRPMMTPHGCGRVARRHAADADTSPDLWRPASWAGRRWGEWAGVYASRVTAGKEGTFLGAHRQRCRRSSAYRGRTRPIAGRRDNRTSSARPACDA